MHIQSETEEVIDGYWPEHSWLGEDMWFEGKCNTPKKLLLFLFTTSRIIKLCLQCWTNLFIYLLLLLLFFQIVFYNQQWGWGLISSNTHWTYSSVVVCLLIIHFPPQGFGTIIELSSLSLKVNAFHQK